jgi:hypothetical protein
LKHPLHAADPAVGEAMRDEAVVNAEVLTLLLYHLSPVPRMTRSVFDERDGTQLFCCTHAAKTNASGPVKNTAGPYPFLQQPVS